MGGKGSGRKRRLVPASVGAKRLLAVMERYGLHFEQVGAELGFTTIQVYRYLNGTRQPTVQFVCKVKEAYGVKIESWYVDNAPGKK